VVWRSINRRASAVISGGSPWGAARSSVLAGRSTRDSATPLWPRWPRGERRRHPFRHRRPAQDSSSCRGRAGSIDPASTNFSMFITDDFPPCTLEMETSGSNFLAEQNRKGHWRVAFYAAWKCSRGFFRKTSLMFSKSRTLLLAATMMAAPLATAVAQQNNPTANMGTNGSATASPGTADTTTPTGNYAGSSMSKTAPGGTGHTVVPGSSSSQASSSAGTAEQKAGPQTK
jgi:hypothetical protein